MRLDYLKRLWPSKKLSTNTIHQNSEPSCYQKLDHRQWSSKFASKTIQPTNQINLQKSNKLPEIYWSLLKVTKFGPAKYHEKKFWTHKKLTRKISQTHEISMRKKFWNHKIPTRKYFVSTRYLWEKIWTLQGTMARWHDGTRLTRPTIVQDPWNLAHLLGICMNLVRVTKTITIRKLQTNSHCHHHSNF